MRMEGDVEAFLQLHPLLLYFFLPSLSFLFLSFPLSLSLYFSLPLLLFSLLHFHSSFSFRPFLCPSLVLLHLNERTFPLTCILFFFCLSFLPHSLFHFMNLLSLEYLFFFPLTLFPFRSLSFILFSWI